jgi:hypothetical protein
MFRLEHWSGFTNPFTYWRNVPTGTYWSYVPTGAFCPCRGVRIQRYVQSGLSGMDCGGWEGRKAGGLNGGSGWHQAGVSANYIDLRDVGDVPSVPGLPSPRDSSRISRQVLAVSISRAPANGPIRASSHHLEPRTPAATAAAAARISIAGSNTNVTYGFLVNALGPKVECS